MNLTVWEIAGANLRHSHVWISWGPWLEHVFISPAQHQIHHSNDPVHFDRNMGAFLAIWDRLFGTLQTARGQTVSGSGLTRGKPSPHTSLLRAYWEPCRHGLGIIWRMRKKLLATLIAAGTAAGLTACGDSSSSNTTELDQKTELLNSLDVPATFNFESRFVSGAESARYSGQVTRQVLIADLNTEIASRLEARITDGTWNPTDKQTVLDVLNSYLIEGTAAIGDNQIQLTTTPATQQPTYNDISTGKNLLGKLAGRDDVTDHKDWDAGDFQGWTIESPEALVASWFDEIATNTTEKSNGADRTYAPTGESLAVYHTQDGLDLKQLVQKFLLGAVTFSQGTDDYLDDATEGKRLLTDNVSAAPDVYTKLEHQYDEWGGDTGFRKNDLMVKGRLNSDPSAGSDHQYCR